MPTPRFVFNLPPARCVQVCLLLAPRALCTGHPPSSSHVQSLLLRAGSPADLESWIAAIMSPLAALGAPAGGEGGAAAAAAAGGAGST